MAVSLNDIGIVLDLARLVQQLGENWYRASTALEEFKTNVADFGRRFEAWQKRAEDYGLSSELTLRAHLDDAKSKLEEEKRRLKYLQKGIGGRWLFKIRGTAFPLQMGESLKNLLTLDERILGDWTADEVADARARKKVVKLAKETFIFRRDDRYVRLPDIEKQIKEALGNCGAANKAVRVVLCHGPAGIGKSCMARNLALDYEEKATAKTSVAESSTAARVDHGAFEQVIYLECGPEVDFKAKKSELLKILGWGECLESEETSRACGAKSSESDETSRGSEAKSSNSILKQLLRERHILIILDDVWSETFLEEMYVLCGKNIRILVTSQRSYLCEHSSIGGVLSIPMDVDSIANKDAIQILKVHAGFAPEDIVPDPIQECMDELIKKLSTNPHTLASVATAVDSRRPTQMREWQNAIREYDFVLTASSEITDSNKTRMKFQGIPYSPSIALKFRRLDEPERKLMILMAMLEGPLVPEVLIQLFYMTILLQKELGSHRSCTSFSHCRRQLEDFQCVKITGRDESFWSIHYLDRLFVETTMIEEVRSMFQKFQNLSRRIQGLESKPQEDLVRLLGALYFKNQWAKQTIQDGSLDVKVTKLDAATRNAIQPTVSLIVENVGYDWSEREQLSADQMFLSYICNAIIHAKAAKVLLRSPKSKDIFCSVILNISKVSDIDLPEKVVLALLDAVGDSKSLNNSSGALELDMSQCEYLLFLAQGAADPKASNFVRYSICRVSMILSGLTQIVTSRPDQPTLQLLSVKILSWLAASETLGRDAEDSVLLLVNTPMLVEGLVRTMEKDELDVLSQSAASTLWRLVRCCDMRHTHLVHPIIIDIGFQSLIDSLAKKGNPVLQQDTAYVLEHIAWRDSEISLKILKCPNVLTYLVDILDSGESPSLVGAVSNLMRTIVINNSTALSETLTKSIFSKVNNCLAQLLRRAPQISEEVEVDAAVTLTWIDPMKGRSVVLSSASAHRTRGVTLVQLGHYRDGLTDLEKAREIEAGKNWDTFRCLITARAKLGDLEGALKDADRASKLAGASMPERRFVIRDRGVVRRLMGDLPGALEDFDEILKIYPNVYPTLKQRAYVKFLMGDEEGARTDGEKARQGHTKYDLPQFKNKRLVYSPVEFLNFQL